MQARSSGPAGAGGRCRQSVIGLSTAHVAGNYVTPATAMQWGPPCRRRRRSRRRRRAGAPAAGCISVDQRRVAHTRWCAGAQRAVLGNGTPGLAHEPTPAAAGAGRRARIPQTVGGGWGRHHRQLFSRPVGAPSVLGAAAVPLLVELLRLLHAGLGPVPEGEFAMTVAVAVPHATWRANCSRQAPPCPTTTATPARTAPLSGATALPPCPLVAAARAAAHCRWPTTVSEGDGGHRSNPTRPPPHQLFRRAVVTNLTSTGGATLRSGRAAPPAEAPSLCSATAVSARDHRRRGGSRHRASSCSQHPHAATRWTACCAWWRTPRRSSTRRMVSIPCCGRRLECSRWSMSGWRCTGWPGTVTHTMSHPVRRSARPARTRCRSSCGCRGP